MNNKETNKEKFIKQLNPLGLYDNILDDIKKYNRADTVNMTEEEMNQFRHIAGPAVLTSNYYPAGFTETLGYLKEVKDLLMGRGLQDTKYDLKNNKIGISIGLKFPNNSNKALYDYIFKNHIEPKRMKGINNNDIR